MLKILGCLFVIASFVCCALNYSINLKKRINGLYFFIRLLELFKIKIEYDQSTVVQLIENLASECSDYDFLEGCLKKVDDGLSLKSAWNNSLDDKSDKIGLTRSDISLLKKFCDELGETDLEGQISNITLYIELLKNNLKELESTAKDKSRVAINTGIFAGVIVAILLI